MWSTGSVLNETARVNQPETLALVNSFFRVKDHWSTWVVLLAVTHEVLSNKVVAAKEVGSVNFPEYKDTKLLYETRPFKDTTVVSK
jgi:hypothetical protein